jgi:hypothetical protein
MHRFLFACLVAPVFAAPVEAQNLTFYSTSLDATVGASYGWGGNIYRERGGVAAELMFVPDHTSSKIGALVLGARGSPIGNDRCDFTPDRTRCLEDFPGTVHIALVAGVENVTTHLILRAVAGPAAFVAGAKGAGPIVRADAAAGATHIKFVVAATGGLDFGPHEPFELGMLTFGIRIH